MLRESWRESCDAEISNTQRVVIFDSQVCRVDVPVRDAMLIKKLEQTQALVKQIKVLLLRVDLLAVELFAVVCSLARVGRGAFQHVDESELGNLGNHEVVQ